MPSLRTECPVGTLIVSHVCTLESRLLRFRISRLFFQNASPMTSEFRNLDTRSVCAALVQQQTLSPVLLQCLYLYGEVVVPCDDRSSWYEEKEGLGMFSATVRRLRRRVSYFYTENKREGRKEEREMSMATLGRKRRTVACRSS